MSDIREVPFGSSRTATSVFALLMLVSLALIVLDSGWSRRVSIGVVVMGAVLVAQILSWRYDVRKARR